MKKKQLACSRCHGDYVVGEGGSLECGRCGHIVGDISLLFAGEKAIDDMNQHQQFDDKALEMYLKAVRKKIYAS